MRKTNTPIENIFQKLKLLSSHDRERSTLTDAWKGDELVEMI